MGLHGIVAFVKSPEKSDEWWSVLKTLLLSGYKLVIVPKGPCPLFFKEYRNKVKMEH